jgi:choline dehydrogenase-like flavoprotein
VGGDVMLAGLRMETVSQLALYDTVSALVYSLAAAQADPARLELQAPYNDLTHFVLRQQAQISDYLRGPLAAVTAGFDLLGLMKAGQLFRHQSPSARQRQIEAWKSSKAAAKRDFIRLWESLVTLALHSRSAALDSAFEMGAATLEPESELRSEIAVIGSGPAGSITACLLAEAGRDVVLVEEGPFHSLTSCPPFSRAEMEQKYRNGGLNVAMGRTKVAYVEGRCVGGGSEINSGLYHRTPANILEAWRKKFQVEALTEADLLPHFEACEKDLSVSHLPGPAPAASLKLHEGAARLGWKSFEVPRWFKYEATAETGRRQSMTETFIPRFLRAGGRLVPQTRVNSMRLEAGQWVLQAHHTSRGPRRISAETVFVGAGAVQTPALLRRSGITRNIGNSLHLHPTIKLVARFPDPVNAHDMNVPVHQVKEFAPRLTFGCSISTQPYLALGLLEHPEALREVPRAWPYLANYYAMITGEGRGTVRPLAGFRDPLVRYHLTQRDRRDLADGLRKLAEALFAAGAVAVYPGLAAAPVLRSSDELGALPQECPAGRASLMTIHLFSSCPMGEDRARCAADSFGRVHGMKNLFIVDASLLCGAPGVNPQGSIMALARRNALRFLNKL